jgi:tripartite-type tricarboxylate transporter receptor subunit TctC
MAPDVVKKVYAAVQVCLRSAELQKEFAREGASAAHMTSAEFGRFIQSEVTKWAAVVKAAKIPLEK